MKSIEHAQRTIKSPRLASAALITAVIAAPCGAESLQDIYEIAVIQDPVIAAARATYRADAEARNQGRAGLLPQVSARASYSDSTNDLNQFGTVSVNGAEIPRSENNRTKPDTESYAINLSQALFDLPAWYSFQRGKNITASAEAQFAADQQNLILRVSEAYFNVLRAFDNTETRDAEQRAIQRQLEQTRERYEVGLVPITDVHEARAVFDEAAVNSLESRGALRIAFEQLQVLTGRRHRVLAGLGAQFAASTPQPTESDAWVDFALDNNFRLKVAMLTKQAAGNNAKAQRYQHLPKLSLSMGYQKSDSDGTQTGVSYQAGVPAGSSADSLTFDRDTDGSSVQLNLSMPIYSGGILHSQRRQSAHRADSAQQNLIAARRNTVQSARSAHQSVMTNAARVDARQQSIVSAQSALKATQAGYEVGTRNIVDVLVAQQAVYRARRNFANTRYDYILSMMRLKQVAGQLSPDDIYQLNAWLQPELVVQRSVIMGGA